MAKPIELIFYGKLPIVPGQVSDEKKIVPEYIFLEIHSLIYVSIFDYAIFTEVSLNGFL